MGEVCPNSDNIYLSGGATYFHNMYLLFIEESDHHYFGEMELRSVPSHLDSVRFRDFLKNSWVLIGGSIH